MVVLPLRDTGSRPARNYEKGRSKAALIVWYAGALASRFGLFCGLPSGAFRIAGPATLRFVVRGFLSDLNIKVLVAGKFADHMAVLIGVEFDFLTVKEGHAAHFDHFAVAVRRVIGCSCF